MLPWVVSELDNQQISALGGASNAVHVRDMGAFGCGSLQYAVHLAIGGVGELDDGAGCFRRKAGHRQFLSSWRR